jgi:8-oxo-dGTP pyrophosphatase MutT (NUDIX family)
MHPTNGPFRPEAPVVAELAAGTVLVRSPSTPLTLLLHHREEDRWCLPKGHVDPGESLATAALRETTEETGIRSLHLGPEVAEVSHRFYVTKRRTNVVKVTVYFLASTEGAAVAPEALFDRTEWVDFPTALKQVPYENDRVVLRAAQAVLLRESAK